MRSQGTLAMIHHRSSRSKPGPAQASRTLEWMVRDITNLVYKTKTRKESSKSKLLRLVPSKVLNELPEADAKFVALWVDLRVRLVEAAMVEGCCP
jgi:hypothetical protein